MATTHATISDEEVARRLGAWLKSLRGEESQIEIMKRADLHFSQISRIERGEIGKPAFVDLVKLARAYGVSPNQLAERAGLWRDEQRGTLDPRLREILDFLQMLSAEERERLISQFYQLYRFLRPYIISTNPQDA